MEGRDDDAKGNERGEYGNFDWFSARFVAVFPVLRYLLVGSLDHICPAGSNLGKLGYFLHNLMANGSFGM